MQMVFFPKKQNAQNLGKIRKRALLFVCKAKAYKNSNKRLKLKSMLKNLQLVLTKKPKGGGKPPSGKRFSRWWFSTTFSILAANERQNMVHKNRYVAPLRRKTPSQCLSEIIISHQSKPSKYSIFLYPSGSIRGALPHRGRKCSYNHQKRRRAQDRKVLR